MRTGAATLIVAALMLAGTSSGATAAPALVNVRIEGSSETLFEGPILAEGHEVKAFSDSRRRSCDGINSLDPTNVTPGPTPTSTSADAMGIIGETFDGKWYPGFNDYFITRWGPDREAGGMSWGILVNNVFTDVGGCQYELDTGDEVLWVYDAFAHRPFLALYPVGDTSGARPSTATVELGKLFEVEVADYHDDEESVPPAGPERAGSSAYTGADVSPVRTSAEGFEAVETESSLTVKTNAEGRANITFTEPGWHRIKATALNATGGEAAIRSNRLDVCVPAEGEVGCGELPAEDQVRVDPHAGEGGGEEGNGEGEGGEGAGPSPGPGPGASSGPGSQEPAPGATSTSGQQVGLGGLAASIAGAPAAGSDPRGGARWPIGRVHVARDDRWSGLRYHGRWRREEQSSAWHGTLTRVDAGAQVVARLDAGRPVFLLRGTVDPAKVEVRAGSHREVFTLATSSAGAARLIPAVQRSHAGRVSLRVLKGAVDLDGVALES